MHHRSADSEETRPMSVRQRRKRITSNSLRTTRGPEGYTFEPDTMMMMMMMMMMMTMMMMILVMYTRELT